MPREQSKVVHCKKCQTDFNSRSELRKHQWASHREIFNKFISKGISKHKKYTCRTCGHVSNNISKMHSHSWIHIKESKTELMKPKANSTGAPDFSQIPVSVLLEKMLKQRDFLNDMALYIKGVISE